jgi:hypothetical protein
MKLQHCSIIDAILHQPMALFLQSALKMQGFDSRLDCANFKDVGRLSKGAINEAK